jgi:hypothetical protein
VESYRGRPPSRTRSCPASSDEEALNEILAQRESRKRRSSETLTASEAPPPSPPVPPRVQEVARRAAHSTRQGALPLPPPILPHVRVVAQRAYPLDFQAGRLNLRRRTSFSSSPSPTAKNSLLVHATQLISSPHNDRQTLPQEPPPSPSRRQPRKPTSRARTSARRK